MKIKEYCGLGFFYLVFLFLPAQAQTNLIPVSENELAPENQMSEEYYFSQGEKQFESQQFREAVKSFKQAVALNPENSKTYNRLCLAYFNLENYRAAIEACQKNIGLEEGKSAIGLFNLGRAYNAASKNEEAVKAFKQAITLQKDFADAYYNLATVYIDLKQYTEAKKMCREAMRLKPEFAEAYFVSGVAKYHLQEFTEAIENFNRAISLNPNVAEIHYNLGVTYLAVRENGKAIERLEKAFQLKTDLSVVPYQLGVAYYRTKKFKKAAEALKSAVEIDPKFERARLALGITYLTLDKKEEALKQYRKLSTANSELAPKLFKYIHADKIIDARKL
jgi:tetratricopeptide (TPR) repeat protein